MSDNKIKAVEKELRTAQKEAKTLAAKVAKIEKCNGDCKHCKYCGIVTSEIPNCMAFCMECKAADYYFDHFSTARQTILDDLKDELYFAEKRVESVKNHLAFVERMEGVKNGTMTLKEAARA